MSFWRKVWDHLKDNLAKYIGGAVATLLVAGGTWLWREFVVPIEVSSSDSWADPDSKVYFAGQQLRFLLKGINPERVIWVFDEDRNQNRNDLVASTTSWLNYSFPFDPKSPQGVSNRRVDAFFKSGTGYRSAWTLVSVANVQVRTDLSVKPIGVAGSQSSGPASRLQLTVGDQPPGGWKLDSARLGTLGDSGVQETQNLVLTPTDLSHKLWNFPARADFGDPKKAWVSLTFTSPSDNRTLHLIKPLTDLESKVASFGNQ